MIGKHKCSLWAQVLGHHLPFSVLLGVAVSMYVGLEEAHLNTTPGNYSQHYDILGWTLPRMWRYTITHSLLIVQLDHDNQKIKTHPSSPPPPKGWFIETSSIAARPARSVIDLQVKNWNSRPVSDLHFLWHHMQVSALLLALGINVCKRGDNETDILCKMLWDLFILW